MEDHIVKPENHNDTMSDAVTANHASHHLAPDDPENPMNWPLHRKLYASAVSWFFAFAV